VNVEEYVADVKAHLDGHPPPVRYRWEEHGLRVCQDCGALVGERESHDRFHAILNEHALLLALLKVSHLAAHVHDRYDIDERLIKARNRHERPESTQSVAESNDG
jgi:hypothetical protein